MICYDSRLNQVELESELDRGGEATIFTIKGNEELVAKIYHKPPKKFYNQKLLWMQKHPPHDPAQDSGHASIAWPAELLFNQTRQLSGYLMPYIGGMVKLINVINPGLRRKVLPGFDWRYLHRTARNLAAAVKALHQRNYVIGDLNESNILVSPSALVTLIDADSFQVYDQQQALLYYCPVGKPEYTPWELQGLDFRRKERTPESDYFALAVIIFQLLLEGSHPYRGKWMGESDPPPTAEKIRLGWFPYGKNHGPNLPPPHAPGLEILHPRLSELLQQCFVDGQADPHHRPSPTTWLQALKIAETELISCPRGHYYSQRLSSCPWCRRTSMLSVPRVTHIHTQEKVQPPQLSIIQSVINFGLATTEGTVERVLMISNRGRGVLTGSLSGNASWLKVSPSGFALRSGEYTRITLVANTQDLPGSSQGMLHSTSIFVRTNGGSKTIQASVRVGAALLELKQDQVDFGETLMGDIAQSALVISNNGTCPLNGQITSSSPWISCIQTAFTCLPGAWTKLILLAHTDQITGNAPEGNLISTLMIKSNGGSREIPVRIHLYTPVLKLKPDRIDLGTITHGSETQSKLIIYNDGRGTLTGTVSSTKDWITFDPPNFSCPTNSSTAVTTTLHTGIPGIPLYREHTTEILVESNGGNRNIEAIFKVDSPILKLHFHDNPLRQSGTPGQLSGNFMVENAGNSPLQLTIESSAPWFQVVKPEMVLAPHKIDPAFFMINTGSSLKDALDPDILTADLILYTIGGEQRVSLEFDPQSAGLRIIKRKLHLDLSPGVEFSFNCIPSGDFWMGHPSRADESIPHNERLQTRLFIDEFWMSQFPVTNLQYKAFIAASGHPAPPHWVNATIPAGKESHPVVCVSWADALAFCHWVSQVTALPVRLPTEVEWEKAARGPDGYLYPWGVELPDRDRCNYEGNDTTPVGVYGAKWESAYGCGDMSGNVWEWTSSLAKPYPYRPDDGRESLSLDGNRILRGGSWFSPGSQARATSRLKGNMIQREQYFGFRCALSF